MSGEGKKGLAGSEQRNEVLVDPGCEDMADSAEHGRCILPTHEVESGSLIEGYCHGKVGVKVGWWTRALEIEPRQFVAIFERLQRVEPMISWRYIAVGTPPRGVAVEVDLRSDREQQPVFVDVTQLVDNPQVVLPYITSLIRLYRIQAGEDIRTVDLGSDSNDLRVSLIVQSRLVDGELRVFTRATPIQQYQLPSKMIERCPEIRERVTDDGAKHGVELRNLANVVTQFGAISVVFPEDGLLCGVDDWAQGDVKVTYVGVCPTELDSYTLQHGNHLLLEDDAGKRAGTNAGDTGRGDDPGAVQEGRVP